MILQFDQNNESVVDTGTEPYAISQQKQELKAKHRKADKKISS